MTDEQAAVPVYRRIMLKLSGEVFGGGQIGVDPDVVQSIARQIAEVVRLGTQVAVVVGGGNFFRGAELSPARHGSRSGRLHGHARHGHELPWHCRTSSRSKASRRACRPRSRWARSPSPTSRGARSDTWRRVAS